MRKKCDFVKIKKTRQFGKNRNNRRKINFFKDDKNVLFPGGKGVGR